jgi:SAM-dependent methyltransferase
MAHPHKLTLPPRARHLVERVVWSTRYYGLPLTLLGSIARPWGRLIRSNNPSERYKSAVSAAFDRRFRVDTGGYIPVGELDIPEHLRLTAAHYQPTAAVTFAVVLAELGIDYTQYIFVDFGSGKGRTLIQAAQFPFQQVLGVELSPGLHAVAERNLLSVDRTRLQCQHLQSICADAGTYEIPLAPAVLYFFHPFDDSVLRRVLENLRRSLEAAPRPVVLMYQHALLADELRKGALTASLKRVFDTTAFLRPAKIAFHDPRWDVYEASIEPYGR